MEQTILKRSAATILLARKYVHLLFELALECMPKTSSSATFFSVFRIYSFFIAHIFTSFTKFIQKHWRNRCRTFGAFRATGCCFAVRITSRHCTIFFFVCWNLRLNSYINKTLFAKLLFSHLLKESLRPPYQNQRFLNWLLEACVLECFCNRMIALAISCRPYERKISTFLVVRDNSLFVSFNKIC